MRPAQPVALHQRFTPAPLAIAVAVAVALAAGQAPLAHAQSAAAATAATPIAINLPAQPLGQALNELARQANLQMTFPAVLVAGKQAPAVVGQLTVRQALDRLLNGSGLVASTEGNSVVVRQALPQQSGELTLPAVKVTAKADLPGSLPKPYAGGQVARGGQVGMLGHKDVMDTPFSQTSYTNKTIQNQQAQTLQDVLSNDPSIVMSTHGSGNDYGANTFRGFREGSENGAGSLNGLAGMSPMRAADMDYIERVEVLRGPSALLNGMAASGAGGLGGSYNLVTKQAGDEPLTELTARYGSRSQLGAHLDVGRRVGAEKQFGIRFNGAYRKGDAPVEPTTAEVGSAALNLDYRGEHVRISTDILHQSDRANPRNFQMLGIGDFIPKAPDVGTSFSPSWSESQEKTTQAMVRGEVDIAENATAYAAVGKQKWDFSTMGPLFVVDDSSGNMSPYNVSRHRLSHDLLSMQAGLRATETTGPVSHALSLNLSQSKREVGEFYVDDTYSYTTNLYNPTFGPAPSLADGDPKKASETRVSSIGIADTLSTLDKRIQFTAGIRRQKVNSRNFDTTTGAKDSEYDSNAWTPALALVVKPWDKVSLYANYIENLQEGSTVSTFYKNAGEVFAPYVSKQYEAGAKVDWGTVTTTLAAFQITQPSKISIDDPAGGLPTQALDGEQRNRGIELNAYGEPLSGVRLMGGLTLLDARRTKTTGGLNDGDRAFGVPKIRTVLGGEWDTSFLQGLTLTGRVTHTGNQATDGLIKGLQIPSWTVVDLGARYVLKSGWNSKPITVRFNVDNVFGKNYWATAYYDLLFLGAPRTYRLSATLRF